MHLPRKTMTPATATPLIRAASFAGRRARTVARVIAPLPVLLPSMRRGGSRREPNRGARGSSHGDPAEGGGSSATVCSSRPVDATARRDVDMTAPATMRAEAMRSLAQMTATRRLTRGSPSAG